jgi:twinkle protein
VLPKSKKNAVNKVEKPQTGNFRPLTPEFLAYFASRGISERTLKRNQVAQESTWMPGQPTGDAIAFPYLRNGEVVNVKYRTMNKCFRQVKGAEKILYGLDDVVGQDTIIIVEGK